MTPSIIKSLSNRSGVNEQLIDGYIIDASNVVDNDYPQVLKDSDKYNELIESIVTHMVGIKKTPMVERYSPVTIGMTLTDAVNESIKNPFKYKSNILFVNEKVFIDVVGRITDIMVLDIDRIDKTSFIIELDNHTDDVSDIITSIQNIYGLIGRDKSLYTTTKINKTNYRINFENKVVMK